VEKISQEAIQRSKKKGKPDAGPRSRGTKAILSEDLASTRRSGLNNYPGNMSWGEEDRTRHTWGNVSLAISDGDTVELNRLNVAKWEKEPHACFVHWREESRWRKKNGRKDVKLYRRDGRINAARSPEWGVRKGGRMTHKKKISLWRRPWAGIDRLVMGKKKEVTKFLNRTRGGDDQYGQ